MRREERIELIFYLRVFDDATEAVAGYLVNVNREGLMVIGPTPLETGRRATFVMELPHHVSTLHELSFEGEVKWAKPAPATDYYHSGIRFLSISNENLAVVEKLSLQFQRKAFGLDLHEEMNPSGIEPC